MTLLVAARAGDGIAALSDRKESGPDREVTKCHMDENGGFYVSLAGDGRAAGGLLRRVAEDRMVQASSIAKRIGELAASLHGQCQPHIRVDGILITSGSRSYKVYDLYIRNGHADLRPNHDDMSMHGDYAAIAICRSLAAGLDTRRMTTGEAAAILHMLASKAATTVDSVGGREEYGFDLAIFGAPGRARLFDRCTDELGTLEIVFHIGSTGGKAGSGGGGRAHG